MCVVNLSTEEAWPRRCFSYSVVRLLSLMYQLQILERSNICQLCVNSNEKDLTTLKVFVDLLDKFISWYTNGLRAVARIEFGISKIVTFAAISSRD